MFLTQALVLLGTLSSQPDPATTRALVVLLDISGSMGIDDAGKSRLVRGCDLIKELARANPPGRESPILLVTFNNSANQASLIQGMDDLERHLKALRPRGGTSISKGLREAGKTVERYIEAKRLELLLITDMEDGEKESIAAEQEKLNKLFQKRGHDGKARSDSLVFVRTWSRDDASAARLNEELTGPIVQNGAAERADIGKDQIVNVTLNVKVEMVHCEWVEPRKVAKATVKASANFHGAKGMVPASCVLTSREGQQIVISSGKGSCTSQIQFTPSASEVTSGSLLEKFTVACDRLQPFPGGIHVIEAPMEISLPIALPKVATSIGFSAKATGQPVWHKLQGDVVKAPITFHWELDGPLDKPFSVLITGKAVPVDGFKVVIDSSIGETTFTGMGNMEASLEGAWSFKLTPDGATPFPIPPSEFSTTVKAPGPVSVRPVVVSGNGKGKGMGGIAWFFQKQMAWELSPSFIDSGEQASALEGLKLRLVMTDTHKPDQSTQEAAVAITDNGDNQVKASFPETGYFSSSRIARTASFVPETPTTSIYSEPLHLEATREAPGLAMLAILLGVVIFGMLAVAVWKLINSSPATRQKYF